ncbi:hypothetical protein JCM10207_006029 [Rhodosporidiobolus poonsookiae]
MNNPYNPLIGNNNSSGGSNTGGGTSNTGSTPSSGASYYFKNVTYSIQHDSWKFTREVAGYEQGLGTFSGTLPSTYADFGGVWYSNAPRSMAVFTSPTNAIAMYLVGSTKSDRGAIGAALRDQTSGEYTAPLAFSEYSATTDNSLHVLYGAEGIDPTSRAPQLFVIKTDTSNSYIAIQGVIVTTRELTHSTGDVNEVDQDTDLLYPVAAGAVTAIPGGPTLPYTTSSSSSSSSDASAPARGSSSSTASASATSNPYAPIIGGGNALPVSASSTLTSASQTIASAAPFASTTYTSTSGAAQQAVTVGATVLFAALPMLSLAFL